MNSRDSPLATRPLFCSLLLARDEREDQRIGDAALGFFWSGVTTKDTSCHRFAEREHALVPGDRV